MYDNLFFGGRSYIHFLATCLDPARKSPFDRGGGFDSLFLRRDGGAFAAARGGGPGEDDGGGFAPAAVGERDADADRGARERDRAGGRERADGRVGGALPERVRPGAGAGS